MISFNPFELIKGKKIIGTWGGATDPDKDFLQYIKAYRSGRFCVNKLITHHYRLKDINAAIKTLEKGEAGRIMIDCT